SASYEYFNTPSGGLINVEAEIKGSSQPYKYIVLGTHYDSISNGESAPGAVDNAASVAIMMELCRLIPKYNLAKSVKLLFFSAEEIGRYGSLNWVNRNHEIRENISAVLILDMVAYGNSLVLDYNSVSKPLADYILEKTSFKNYLTVEANNYLSDHQSFWSANMPAVLIHQNDPLEYPYYHTPEDTVDKVDFNMLMLTASITLEAAYYLATDLNFENLYYGVNLIYPIIILSLPIAFLTCLGVIIKFKNRRSSSENSS
ncbi:MAG: M20/M25/M40 family metallo-hydrolase, partial [Candidatus Odinarchaeota archaeon]